MNVRTIFFLADIRYKCAEYKHANARHIHKSVTVEAVLPSYHRAWKMSLLSTGPQGVLNFDKENLLDYYSRVLEEGSNS